MNYNNDLLGEKQAPKGDKKNIKKPTQKLSLKYINFSSLYKTNETKRKTTQYKVHT